jgi:hypothetical protein
MQALYNYLEEWTDQGTEEFRMEVAKLPGGMFRFRIAPVGRAVSPETSLYIVVTKSGLTPLDNRRSF